MFAGPVIRVHHDPVCPPRSRHGGVPRPRASRRCLLPSLGSRPTLGARRDVSSDRLGALGEKATRSDPDGATMAGPTRPLRDLDRCGRSCRRARLAATRDGTLGGGWADPVTARSVSGQRACRPCRSGHRGPVSDTTGTSRPSTARVHCRGSCSGLRLVSRPGQSFGIVPALPCSGRVIATRFDITGAARTPRAHQTCANLYNLILSRTAPP